MLPPCPVPLTISGPQGLLQGLTAGGAGTPVVFVHGNGGCAGQWEQQMALLAGKHPAAALDLRGMGESAPPRNGDFSVGGFAEDIGALAQVLDFAPFVLVGHSFGASVAACYACRSPGRIKGLVLVDVGGDVRNDPPEAIQELMEGLRSRNFEAFTRRAVETCLTGAGPEVTCQVLAQLGGTPWRSFAEAVKALLDFDMMVALAAYGGPVHHIHGPFLEAMELMPIHRREPMTSARLERCSHWVHLDRPEAFHAALADWLDDLPPWGPG